MSAKHENINDEVREQKQKFKDMTFKEKWRYFWDYYKIHTIVTIFAVILIVTFAKDMILNNQECVLSVAMINGYPVTDSDVFMEEYATYAEIDSKEYEVTLDTSYQYSKDDMSQMTMATVQKLMALVSASALDVMISDYEAVDNYANSGFFVDLRTVLPADLLEKFKDSFYYYTYDPNLEVEGFEPEEGYLGPFDTLEPVPVGIIATDFPKLVELGAYEYTIPEKGKAEPIFTILGNSKYIDSTIQFLRFLSES